MSPDASWWIGFHVFVFGMLAIDLGIFHRHAHEVKMREAVSWSVVWVSLAVVFNLGLYFGWIGSYAAEVRPQVALEFLTGYLVEESLSVDNVFVFALLFKYFRVPAMYQHRILFWGILGALIMRGTMIFAGVALIQRFHWITYVFGLILILSGVKMWRADENHFEPEHNPVLKFVRRMVPVSQELHGQRFFIRSATGALLATPLFVVLVFVEWSDLVFAVDSIPAILAITQDPFIVYTSNVMALLGLRSLYFAVAGVMQKFHLLHYGLSILLAFIGIKMIIADLYKIPTPASLAVIAAILILSCVASVIFPKRETADQATTDPTPPDA